MLKISVKLDIQRLKRDIDLEQKQVRFATAVALTRTAKHAETKVQEEIGRAFDRPTRFTQKSTYVTAATKQRLWAEVKIKDEALKAVAPIRWLAPQIYGGGREAKRSEALLRGAGILGNDQFIVPAAGAKLDRHGNMSRGQMQQILSQVRAQRDALANQTGRSKARNKGRAQYFAIVHQRGKLKPGIYQRIGFAHGSAVRPVLIFVKRPTYRKRFRFFEVAERASRARFPHEFEAALRHAMATAR